MTGKIPEMPAKRVERGARYLDSILLGVWAKRVTKSIEMKKPCACVAGQVFASDAEPGETGFDHLTHTLPRDVSIADLEAWDRWIVDHGFDCDWMAFDDVPDQAVRQALVDADYRELRDAWAVEVRARR